jgi:hypothetical protein
VAKKQIRHRLKNANKREYLVGKYTFSNVQLAIFVLAFAAVGYLIFRSFAATGTLSKTWDTDNDWDAGAKNSVSVANGSVSLTGTVTGQGTPAPTPPSGAATITLTPGTVDHTLPQYFYGVGQGVYFNTDSSIPAFMDLIKGLQPEIIRYHMNSARAGTVQSPNSNMNGFLTSAGVMAPLGTKILLQLSGWPTPGGAQSTTSPYSLSNVDSGAYSPASVADWAKEFDRRWPGSIYAVEDYNEPATQGNGNWYGPNSSTYSSDPTRYAADWATVHNGQYYDAFKSAMSSVDPSAKYYGGVFATTDNSYAANEVARFLDGAGTSGINNMLKMDVFSFHGYQGNVQVAGGSVGDWQAEINALYYPTYTAQKGGYTAGAQEFRDLLDQRNGQNIKLAESEFGAFGHDGKLQKGAMMDVGLAISSAKNQAKWNLDQVSFHAANRDQIDSSGNTIAGGGGDSIILNPAGTNTFIQSVRYEALRDMIQPFLHNYKRQLNVNIANASLSPVSGSNNATTSIQVAAGLNANGTKLGVLVQNIDLTNAHTFGLNLNGTLITGAVTGRKLPVDQGWDTPLPTLSSIPTTIGAGEVYFLEIPIATGSISYPPSGSITLTHDAGQTVDWASATPLETKPTGTNITYTYQSSDNGTTWSSPVSDITTLTSSRYIQIIATLATTNSSTTPSLDKLTITYDPTGSPPPPSNPVDCTNGCPPVDGQQVTITGPTRLLPDNSNEIITQSDGTGHRLIATSQVTDATIRSFDQKTVTVVGTESGTGATFPINVTSITVATTPPPLDTTAPTTPAGLSSTGVTSTSISLAWNASTDTGGSGLLGYKLYRNGTFITQISSLSFTDSSLTANTSYAYKISAIDNSSNESAQSLAVNVSTAANPPPPLTNSCDLNNDGSVDIFDLSILLSRYGGSGVGDIDKNGIVDIFDLSKLLALYQG